MTTAQDIIDLLKLERHPEGGWYVQTYRDPEGIDGRAHSTAI
ncbi:MAG: cupin, partial [Burkholderiales bacterium]